MSAPQRDPELEALFEDPDLRDLAQLMHAAPHPSAGVEADPAFRMALRRRLVQEAWKLAEPPRLPWYRRILRAPATAAWAGAAVGVLLIGVTALAVLSYPGGRTDTVITVDSPLENADKVALAEPIQLQFTAPMDRRSVEQAVIVHPATAVKYTWVDDRTVKITPVNGDLVPNTRYEVQVASTAKSKDSGKKMDRPAVVTFVTQPTPAPAPSAAPSAAPTATPSGVSGVRELGPASSLRMRWSTDGATLYVIGPGGVLQAFPVAGGDGRKIATDGVTLVSISPDGFVYVRNGQVVSGQSGQALLNGVQPVAIGFLNGDLIFATNHDVQRADRDRTRAALFAEEAQSADFSPDGASLAYRGASGNIHVVDLTSGKDVQVGQANGLGDWAPDGKQYAYPAEGGVFAVADGGIKKLADLSGVTAISWSPAGQLLLTTSSALSLVNADGSGLKKLADGVFDQSDWSPAGRSFAFKRGGSAFVAMVTDSRQGGAPAAATPQDEAARSFLDALKARQTDQVSGLLDPAGRDAFGKIPLLSSDSTVIARHYVLLSQPGRVVARLVLGQSGGGPEQALDLALTFQKDQASGKLLIHGLSAGASRTLGSGPEVRNVVVSPGQVKVAFDSDLDPSTVQLGLRVRGVSGQASYDARSRTVTLSVPTLAPSANYQLEVTTALQDVSRRPAAPYLLSFSGPTA